MNITIHIDRLVLDGLPLERSAGSMVQAGLEKELARLLVEQGLQSGWKQGGAVAALSAPSIALGTSAKPLEMGEAVGQAIHHAMNGQSGRGGRT
jgi:hypothetical protein